MKKSKFFGFLIVAALLFVSSPAFALNCKTGNDASDECWTTAQLTTNDKAVIAGTLMVYDFQTPTQASPANSSDNAAFFVRAAGAASRDINIMAGVAQKTYASGDRVQLLVRGKGVLRVNSSTVTSGDQLIPQAQSGTGNFGEAVKVASTETNSRDKAVAFALQNSTSAATIDAFIVIV